MTDLIKGQVVRDSGDLVRDLARKPALIRAGINLLLQELDDLGAAAPTIIAFGKDAYRLAASHIPPARYSRLAGIMHYSHYISKEDYRRNVLAALAPTPAYS